MQQRLIVASSPHVRAELNVQKIMGWVLISLAPAGLAGVYFFGMQALVVMIACVVACVLSELAWQKCAGQTCTISDLSAAVTGLLLAYNLPPTVPIWMAVAGSVFSIIIVKQFFGGLGQNIVNPALAGRAMMLISWPVAMTTWTLDGVTGATPLAIIKGVSTGNLPNTMDMIIGRVGGCIGETSAIALLIGGILLLAKGIITWRIPVVYIATVAVLSLLLGRNVGPFYEILSGGLLLGAFFMATDYTSSPMSPKGHILFAFGCGLITLLIRAFGSYPEGVSFSILIMNIAVPLIDRYTRPEILGEVKKNG